MKAEKNCKFTDNCRQTSLTEQDECLRQIIAKGISYQPYKPWSEDFRSRLGGSDQFGLVANCEEEHYASV